MEINDLIIEDLLKKAKENIRLRENLCLHESQKDKVQKMINVLIPGTKVPIHCHLNSNETLVLLRGSIFVIYYDKQGTETKRFFLSTSKNQLIDIKRGQWHSVFVNEPVVLFEVKEGPYRPLLEEEILK